MAIEQVAAEEKKAFGFYGEYHELEHGARFIVKDGRPYIHLNSFISHVQAHNRMGRKKIAADLHVIGAKPVELWGWKRKYRVWRLPDDLFVGQSWEGDEDVWLGAQNPASHQPESSDEHTGENH